MHYTNSPQQNLFNPLTQAKTRPLTLLIEIRQTRSCTRFPSPSHESPPLISGLLCTHALCASLSSSAPTCAIFRSPLFPLLFSSTLLCPQAQVLLSPFFFFLCLFLSFTINFHRFLPLMGLHVMFSHAGQIRDF